MGCDYPLRAFRSKTIDPETGRRGVTFKTKDAQDGLDPFEVPCGNCTGCRLERSRQWAVRMMHEAQMHEFNNFLTLTYNPQTIPQNYGLCLEHLQRFMKRYRKHVASHHKGLKIRFYAAGEYGDEGGRPHYHACIFGHDFPDKVPAEKNGRGEQLYTSETLDALWTENGTNMGRALTGTVTFDSAAYVARYCMKKINGDKSAEHYARVSPIDGKVYTVRPEFAVMSRRPGIGQLWLDQYKSDVFPSGYIIANGHKATPPRFYLNKLADHEKEELSSQAWTAALPYRQHQTKERRAVRAAVRDARISRLKRNLEG